MGVAEMEPFRPAAPFAPFTSGAEQAHRETSDALVEQVMNRINGLLDPEYRYGDDHESGGVSGVQRFI